MILFEINFKSILYLPFLMMIKYKNKCINNCKPVISNDKTNMSTKAINALNIKLNGRKGVLQVNSRLQSIYNTILSLDKEQNKSLLLTFRYTLYIRYFNSIASCSVGNTMVFNLRQMLEEIIASLTPEEYNIVFNIIIPEPVVPFDVNNLTIEYTFEVIVRDMITNKYFMITNLPSNYIFTQGKNYIFDLSDPTNLNTKFALSYEKNGVHVPTLNYVGTPGQPGAYMVLQVEKYLTKIKMYVFNDLIRFYIDNRILSNAYDYGFNCRYLITSVGYNVLIRPTLKNRFELRKNIKPESILGVYESNGPKYYINEPISTNSIFYVNPYRYLAGCGTYYLYVPKIYAACLINKGLETSISFIGDSDKKSIKYLKNISLVDGSFPDGSYQFFWGNVALTIYRPFTQKLSFYSKTFGFIGGEEMLQYSSDIIGIPPKQFFAITDVSLNYDYCGVSSQTKVNVVYDLSTNIPYIRFGNDTTYNSRRKYGLYLGEYMIFIPQESPITFLNRGKENIVQIESISKNSERLNIGPDGNIYTFYYGLIRLTIKGNFGRMSLYSYHKGYMGGFDLFKYDSKFNNLISYPDPSSQPIITVQPSNTSFTDVDVSFSSYTLNKFSTNINLTLSQIFTIINTPGVSYNKNTIDIDYQYNININNYPHYPYVKFKMSNGIYIFNCLNNKIALLNKGIENSIVYTGSPYNTSITGDGILYYNEFMVVYVKDNFEYVSLDVLNKKTADYIFGYE
jgi:hypothetical protein